MRAIAFLAVLTAASPAYADSFVDIFGGLSIPVGDDDWTNVAESSPKLGLRIGAVPNSIGGFLQADWTPVNTDADSSWDVGIASGELSAHRFRIHAGVLFRHALGNTLAFAGRAGIGTDIHHASASGEVLGNTFESSETDAGLGLEFGGGLWFRAGGVEIGAELGFPIGLHDHDGEGELDFEYTTYDLELLLAVRFASN